MFDYNQYSLLTLITRLNPFKTVLKYSAVKSSSQHAIEPGIVTPVDSKLELINLLRFNCYWHLPLQTA